MSFGQFCEDETTVVTKMLGAIRASIAFLAVICVLSGGAIARGQAAAPATADPSAKAHEILNEIVAGQFDKVEAQYDAAMKAALPAGKLGETWKQILGQTGGFKGVTSESTQTIRNLPVVILVCAFERTTLDAWISVNADGTIAGIRFRPHKDMTPWAAPTYAKPESFHEDPITVTFGRWKLPGTLTTPQGDGPFPVVVLLHGSGPLDQDETVGSNKPFKDLAWGLASNGVAVLRYPKRTAQYGAESVDDVTTMTVNDESANDAKAAVELASTEPKIDPKRVFLLGHSDGGYIAPRIATGDPEIAGLILFAAAERPLEKMIIDQLRYLSSLPGVPPDQAQKQMADAQQAAKAIESPDLKKGDMVEIMGTKVPASYFLDLRGYDPAEAAAKLKIPMLVLQGGRDYQVTASDDFEVWKKDLNGHANVTFKLYPDLNHLFQVGEGKSTPAEYQKAGHVAPEVVTDVADWVKKTGKGK
jgi:uncharacterized protein